jgi:hypothetical protein
MLPSLEGLFYVLAANGGLEIAFANTPLRKLFAIRPIYLLGRSDTSW